jgi:hypothetical protein
MLSFSVAPITCGDAAADDHAVGRSIEPLEVAGDDVRADRRRIELRIRYRRPARLNPIVLVP